MRKFFAVLLLTLFAATQTVFAATEDMHEGSFSGQWCGLKATFDIQTRQGDDWIFEGRVLIEATGEYDRLWIEQYGDNSLRMIRYLTGAYEGQTQTVQTFTPRIKKNNSGLVYAQWKDSERYGYGCSGGTTINVW